MIIAVTALGPGLDGAVSEKFGRAPWLVFVDPEALEVETIDNMKNQDALRGAGTASVEALSEHGADVVLTGRVGPNAAKALEIAGISVHKVLDTTVEEAVRGYLAGELEPVPLTSAGRPMRDAGHPKWEAGEPMRDAGRPMRDAGEPRRTPAA